MSAVLTLLIGVIKFVPTRLDRFSAAVLMATFSLLITNDLVKMSMNVQLVHITASNAASTSMEGFHVAVTQATSSILTR